MQYVRDSFWAGRQFDSLAAMQAEAIRWCREVAGTSHSRALDGGQPATVFEAAERTALIPLPATGFQLATWSVGKVAVDCHVKVGKALYSVPWRLIGTHVHDPANDPDKPPTRHRRSQPVDLHPRPTGGGIT